jgi:hypothetical protein
MMKRLVAGLAMAFFLTAGISFAGTVTVDSFVTSSGSAANTYHHIWWGGGHDNGWSGYSSPTNDTSYSYNYSCCPGDGSQYSTYNWLQVALPSLTGTMTSAWLYIDVLSDYNYTGSGIYAVLYHTTNASSANGNASQGLSGDTLVQNITAGPGWLGLNVTSFIQGDYTNHYSWAAFQLNPGADGASYNSDFQYGTPGTGSGPYLEITTTTDTPEPATLSVAGLVLLAVGLVSRRRRNMRA